MGELILTSSAIAAKPYYIEDASLNIYSLEELSYYIYNNAYLINDGFVNETLCTWIEKEVKDKRLASEIMSLLNDKVSTNVIISHILKNNGYLTKSEIKSCVEIISSFEGKTEAEIKKLRADHMMKDGRLADAVFSYEMIIDRKMNISDSLKGDILHNMGCALSGLFFFNRAISVFEQAYRLNRNDCTLDNLLYACMFIGDEETIDAMVKRYMILPEDLARVRENFNSVVSSQSINMLGQDVGDRISHTKDDVEKEMILSNALEELKNDYRNLRTY